MSIRIKKEQSGSFAQVTGANIDPIPVNSFVCQAAAADGKITIANPDQQIDGDPRTLLHQIPFTEFVKSDGSIPTTAEDLAADITAQLEQGAPTDATAGYRGNYDPTTNTPNLAADIASYVNGDLFFSTGDAEVDLGGGNVNVGLNDQIKLSITYDGNGAEVSRQWNLIPNTSPSIAQIESSAINEYDVVIDSRFTGESNGTALRPWKDVVTGIANTQPNNTVLILGTHYITTALNLPHGLRIDGVRNTTFIEYENWDKANEDVIVHDGDGTQAFVINNIQTRKGEVGIRITNAADVRITGVVPTNNGWSGQGLNTALSSATSGVLGYDSPKADLKAFAEGVEVNIDGGGIVLKNVKNFVIRDTTASGNLRGIKIEGCGKNGGNGVIMDSRSSGNLESGFFRVDSENITVVKCYSLFNANNGILDAGSFNCEVSNVKSYGNWNGGHYNWASANITLRDTAIYNCNRSPWNAIGNPGDALASLGIADAYNYLGTIISFRPDARFIQKTINTQVHYTGLGSNVKKVGVKLLPTLNTLPANLKNKIDFENCDFIGQDVDIDFSESDLTNLHVTLKGNIHQDVGEVRVAAPLVGGYYELPFSNLVTRYNEVDFSGTDSPGNITLREGPAGSSINVYPVGQLLAVELNNQIRIIQKDSDKIQFEVAVDGCSVGGLALTGTTTEKVDTLNTLLQNTGAATGESPDITSSLAVSMVQNSTLNYELTADFAVAYEWDFSNVPGITTVDGNVRKIIGGSGLAAGSYAIPVKAINYNGVDSKTLLLEVNSNTSFSNNKSIQMSHQDNLRMVDDGGGLLAPLERATNNNGEAWSISMWMKPANDSRSQIWLYAGQTSTNLPYIELRQTNRDNLRLRYGRAPSNEYVQIEAQDVLNLEEWNHVLITHTGGDTGPNNIDRGDEFSFFINGVEITGLNYTGNGFDGALPITRVRVGRTFNSNSIKNGYLDELATFSTDKSAAAATLAGGPDDLSATADTWHRFGDGVGDSYPYIYDQIAPNDDTRRMQMINQTSANIVNDAP